MSAKLSNLKEENGRLTFTLSNIDVCYANAIRRILMSSIEIIGFKTSPYEENMCNIQLNETRIHNEIIKQRLSCIPVCISDIEHFPIDTHVMELDVENDTDTEIIVTTKDFKIKNTSNNQYLDEAEVRKIFPPFVAPNGEEYFIDFLSLRPRLSEQIPGNKIKLSSKFSVVKARDDSSFNVCGTCGMGCTPDVPKMKQELEIRKQKWKDEGKTEAEVAFEASNWTKLEGLRYIILNSFDWALESVGIYSNETLMVKACILLLEQLEAFRVALEQDQISIQPSMTTENNFYDVILINGDYPFGDYTFGNILNYEMYQTFFVELKTISSTGFKKMHPHDEEGLLRISLVGKTDGTTALKTMLVAAIENAVKTTHGIKGCFDGSRRK
jgi:DNA-directed RNA polymerase subunit L